MILLKNPMNASTKLSMNGKSPMILEAPPFVLRLSKDERRVFQQNLRMNICGCACAARSIKGENRNERNAKHL
jgi:hypothetical protein